MLQDVRYALRTLRRSPGMAALAVLCMGLGIGAVTTIYGTASAFTFRPLPQVRDADRLMHVWESPAAQPRLHDVVSNAVLEDLRRLDVFSDVTGIEGWEANIAGMDVPERVRAARVSAGFLRTLGRVPALGRDFVAAEETAGNDRVMLLTHGLWQRRFGGDRALLGRAVRLNGVGHVVVGILPDDFVFPAGAEVLLPLAPSGDDRTSRTNRSLVALARLAPGVSVASARAAVRTLGARLAMAHPEASAEWIVDAEPAERWYGEGPRPFMWVLLASASFVLLIACANIANLLLVRATTRRRELAVRVTLGASGRRIAGQLLAESVVIGLGGGVVGVLFALAGLDAMSATVPVEIQAIIPGFGRLRMEPASFAFAALVAVGAGILAGLAPALFATRGDLPRALKEGGRGEIGGSRTGRLRAALVVTEVAMALILLAGATLMTVTFRRLMVADPGFRTQGVLTFGVTLDADYPDDAALRAFTMRLEDRLVSLAGVEAAGATTVLPMAWDESRVRAEVEGRPLRRPEEAPVVGFRRVSAGYLPAIGVALRRGRPLAWHDDETHTDVGLVSAAAAARLWPGEDPVGRRLRVRGRWVEIVGVVSDVRGNVLITDDPRPVLYVPLPQWPSRSPSFVVRTGGDPVALAPAVQREIAALDAGLAAGDVASMGRVVLGAVSPQRATAQTLVVAALIALVMAVVGTYGVLAYSVTQRTQEIGVRMAIGVSTTDVLALILRQASVQVMWGIAFGVAGAVAMGRGMRAILYETDATDPLVLGGAALVLGVVSLAAAWLPARWASRVDPVVALRAE